MIRVDVDGVLQVNTALEGFKLKSSDLSNAWQAIGKDIETDAKTQVPVLTGRLLNSIRAGKAKSRAVVRAGRASMPPYAGVQHFGWPGHNIEAKPFLTTPLFANKQNAVTKIQAELAKLIREFGLS